jgi:DNA-binding FrmR family transcriptional regulator
MQADKQAVGNLLKTARGQIDGILKMIEDDRYCIDISTQLMAAQSVLKKANKLVIEAHLNHCVKEAVEQNNAEEKIREIMGIIDKLSK